MDHRPSFPRPYKPLFGDKQARHPTSSHVAIGGPWYSAAGLAERRNLNITIAPLDLDLIPVEHVSFVHYRKGTPDENLRLRATHCKIGIFRLQRSLQLSGPGFRGAVGKFALHFLGHQGFVGVTTAAAAPMKLRVLLSSVSLPSIGPNIASHPERSRRFSVSRALADNSGHADFSN